MPLLVCEDEDPRPAGGLGGPDMSGDRDMKDSIVVCVCSENNRSVVVKGLLSVRWSLYIYAIYGVLGLLVSDFRSGITLLEMTLL